MLRKEGRVSVRLSVGFSVGVRSRVRVRQLCGPRAHPHTGEG